MMPPLETNSKVLEKVASIKYIIASHLMALTIFKGVSLGSHLNGLAPRTVLAIEELTQKVFRLFY